MVCLVGGNDVPLKVSSQLFDRRRTGGSRGLSCSFCQRRSVLGIHGVSSSGCKKDGAGIGCRSMHRLGVFISRRCRYRDHSQLGSNKSLWFADVRFWNLTKIVLLPA